MKLFRNVAAIVVMVIVSMSSLTLVAQNLNTSNLSSSPYTRYGYGRLGSLGNSVTRSMGDVGIALRTNQYTTLANPASLTAIDTLTMIFSMGLDAQYGHYTEGSNTNNKWDAGFSYMSFHAPLWRNFAMSLSLSPYSMVGYYYGTEGKESMPSSISKDDTLAYKSTHNGVGGINNFMFGLGWRAYSNKQMEANVGVNVGWLFGTIEHNGAMATSAQASGTYIDYSMTARGLFLELGLQYTYKFHVDQSVTLGAIWAPQLNLSADTKGVKYSTDSITWSDRFRNDIKLPSRFGLGLTYNIARKLTVTAEYENTLWSKVKGFDTSLNEQSDLFNDAQRVAAGIEYQPKTLTNNYFKICRYRAGLSYKTSYLKVNGNDFHEIGANIGMSLPINTNKRSAFDIGFGYSGLRPSGNSMLKEDYLTLNVGITFNEMMFFRNRLR